nr:hypothetical protein [Tanacetum cinerariifolium]
PKKVSDALQDPSWVEAMQEELLQFKIQKVWTLVYCPKGVRPIGTKWVLKNKKDERGTIVRNKARLPPRFQDPAYPAKVYKVGKAMYGLHQAPRAWQREDFILVQVYVDDIIFGSSNLQLCKEFEALMHEKFQMSAMGDIFKKFGFSNVRSSNAPMDKENPWGKDEPGKDVEHHLYRSMIGSLMYLTSSRPDIMFAVYAWSSQTGVWYPKASPFDLVAYSDSDYGGASQDRKSTAGGSQFLRRRLISWQCKKQTIVATSTTEAEYVATASCCGQVL